MIWSWSLIGTLAAMLSVSWLVVGALVLGLCKCAAKAGRNHDKA